MYSPRFDRAVHRRPRPARRPHMHPNPPLHLPCLRAYRQQGDIRSRSRDAISVYHRHVSCLIIPQPAPGKLPILGLKGPAPCPNRRISRTTLAFIHPSTSSSAHPVAQHYLCRLGHDPSLAESFPPLHLVDRSVDCPLHGFRLDPSSPSRLRTASSAWKKSSASPRCCPRTCSPAARPSPSARSSACASPPTTNSPAWSSAPSTRTSPRSRSSKPSITGAPITSASDSLRRA